MKKVDFNQNSNLSVHFIPELCLKSSFVVGLVSVELSLDFLDRGLCLTSRQATFFQLLETFNFFQTLYSIK